MNIAHLVTSAAEQGVFLYEEGGQLKFKLSVAAFPEPLKQQILAHKAEIIAFLRVAAGIEETDERPPVTKRAGNDLTLPGSFAQQRLWFIDQLEQGSAQYNMSAALCVEGKMDLDIAEQAISRIIERHQTLRTVFTSEEQGPEGELQVLQVIRPEFEFKLGRHDLSALAPQAQDSRLYALIEQDRLKSFDLSRDLMIRVCHIERGAGKPGVILFNMHHIASDGWSIGVLLKEFVEQYRAIAEKRPNPLTPLAIQYADYAQWQRDWLQGDVLERQLSYWQQQLADAPVVHELPLDFARPADNPHLGGVVESRMPPALASSVQQLAQRHQLTPFMLLHGALALVLSRHANQSDIVIGTPVANRMQLELKPLIGFFVNTLVLRVDTAKDSLADYFSHVRSVNLDAQAHQDIPFEQLVEHCKVPRSTLHTPLYQILFAMDTFEHSELALPGVQFKPLEGDKVSVKFDLSINAALSEQGLVIRWTYDSALFSREHVEQFAEHFANLLGSMINTPSAKPAALAMLSAAEQQQILDVSQGPQVDRSARPLLHELFANQAALTPQNTAVRFGGQSLDYRTLDNAANRLANYLLAAGVKPGGKVGIYASRYLSLPVAMLGVAKAGAAYVMLSPDLPQERLSFVVKDAAITQILSPEAGLSAMQGAGAEVLSIEGAGQSEQWLAQYAEDKPEVTVDGESLLYVLYTSGSTGKPKGVELSHASVLDYCLFARDNYYAKGAAHCEGSIVVTSPTFDISVPGFFVPLISGSEIELLTNDDSLEVLSQRLQANQESPRLMRLTPMHVQGLLDLLPSEVNSGAHVFVVGGERFAPSLASALVERFPHAAVYNHYGPTEATVGCCMFDVAAIARQLADYKLLPIGSAMENTRLLVLDQHRRLLPLGVAGELYIGGPCLAKGYLGNPELTAEAFVADPFNPGERLYKTGDKVKYRADGQLEFIDRLDAQVKIRGFRVELGDIESQLNQAAEVAAAVVLVKGDADLQQLVAYVVPTSQANSDGLADVLKARLQKALPDYMVPSVFMLLDALPLTRHGKVDRKALPAIDGTLSKAHYQPPQGQSETALAEIWAKLLKREADTIGREDDFFALGGHSLLAVRLVAQCRQRFGRELAVKTIFASPTLQALAEQIDGEGGLPLRTEVRKVSRKPGELVAASFAQQRLWFIDKLQGGSSEYNTPAAVAVEGHFDVNAAEKALQTLIERHEVLRTQFVAPDDGQENDVLQRIVDDVEFHLTVHDLSAFVADEQATRVDELLATLSAKAFDLSRDLMVRVDYLSLSPSRGVVLFNMHHIASDGWSRSVLLKEFAELYRAAVDGRPHHLPPLDIQYADYALWQRDWLQGEVLDAQLGYWQSQLADAPVVHSLTLKGNRPEVKTHQGDKLSRRLSVADSERLLQLAAEQQITPFMLLHGALALVLSRHSNSHDIVIGTPVANRLQAELAPLIGFFVNSLVLRVDTRQPTLADYFGHIKSVNLDAQAHQDVPFEFLVEHLKVTRSRRHTPLFQIVFAMNTNEQTALSFDDVSLKALDSMPTVVKFDLDINAEIVEGDQGRHIDFSWCFDTALFDRGYIEQVADHLNNLLQAIAASDSDVALRELSMLSSQETHRLLHQVNEPMAEYGVQTLIHQRFEQQAAATPDNTALVFGARSVSYRELNAMANRLALHLRSKGVVTDSLCGLCFERGIDMVVAILAILKAGGAYVPIDPSNPRSRIEYILGDAKPTLLLSQKAVVESLDLGDAVPLVLLDDDSAWSGNSAENLAVAQDQSDESLAYVIYTSGSTGAPKGVLQNHHNVGRLFRATEPDFGFGQSDVWTLFHSIAFDFSVWELWGALLYGGKLVVPDHQITRDTAQFIELCRDEGVTILNQTPSAFQAFSQLAIAAEVDLSCLRFVVFGGEALQFETLQAWWQHYGIDKPQLINMYGITETTVHVTFKPVTPDDLGSASIGHALRDQAVFLLDEQMTLVPPGSVGEIYVGGAGLARGYLNRPELSAERFVASPFEAGKRLYRTGDLGRFLDNGELAYMGRIDDQVKIRGFRIELGEIESRLAQCEAVAACLVMVAELQPGDKQLVAYVVPNSPSLVGDNQLVSALKAELGQSLPSYMVPSAFVTLAQLPLTANGKVDKKALPPVDAGAQQGAVVAPQGQTEQQLAALYAELLGLPGERIGRHSDFFALGGHSLLSVRLASAIRRVWGLELPVRVIFDHAVLERLAGQIDNMLASGCRSARPAIVAADKAQRRTALELSFAQQRLWFIDQLQGTSAEYNMPAAFWVEGTMDIELLSKAMNTIVERHEVLRSRYLDDGQGVRQWVQDDVELVLGLHDLRELSEAEQDIELQRLIDQDANQSFDLSQGLMLRASVVLLKSGDEEERPLQALLFNMHHIASDGWSIDLFSKELFALYQSLVEGKDSPLPPLELQYSDYARWQRAWSQSEAFAGQLDYWDRQLDQVSTLHQLPLDAPRPQVKQHQGQRLSHRLDGAVAAGIEQLASAHQLTPFMLCHSAFALMLARHSDSHDIVVGTPVANRLQSDVEPLIGFFVNTLVLRVDTRHATLGDYLAHVREVHLGAQSNQDVPFEQLVERLNIPRTSAHTPLFQLMLHSGSDFDGVVDEVELAGATVTAIRPQSVRAKFDIDLQIDVDGQGVNLIWTYDKAIFSAEHIAQFNYHLSRLLETLAQSQPASETTLAQLPMLSPSELDFQVKQLNSHRSRHSMDECIAQVFERQVQVNPEAVALTFESQSLSYGELNRRANRLAHYLREQHGVGPDTLVGLCVERSPDMLAGIIAIIKAGGAYVPLDPNYPQARLDYIIEDAGLDLVLVQSHLTVDLGNCTRLALDSEAFDGCSEANIDAERIGLTSANLAYVIYTSGSTGQSKGVLIEHRNVTRLFESSDSHFGFGSQDVWTLFHSFAFDFSVWEIWGALLYGGRLVIVPDVVTKSTDEFYRLVAEQQVTVLNQTPGAFYQFIAMDAEYARQLALRAVIFGGEALSLTALKPWVERHGDAEPQLINMYGITETTVHVTYRRILAEDIQSSQEFSPIGVPLSDLSALLLTKDGSIAPLGVPAELYVGGNGLARGYLNKPALTAERFIDNPYFDAEDPDSSPLLYKTGDLVKYQGDGELVYLGRMDDQVKIRGYRIELGEIEHQLGICEPVDSALVLAKDIHGSRQLVAYLKLHDSEDSDQALRQVRQRLETALPGYMVPGYFVLIEQWPLTVNGKVDKKALPEHDGNLLAGEYVAPQSETEKALVAIWSELLDIDSDRLSIDADFFASGGHSLLAVQLLNRIREQLAADIALRLIFEASSVRAQAELIDIQRFTREDDSTAPSSESDEMMEFEL